MADIYNIWLAVSSQARTEYASAKQASEDGTAYNGPMDAKTFKITQQDFSRRLFLAALQASSFWQ